MCGIVGVAGNLFTDDYKAFRDMLLFDVVRGQDSTGIVRVPITKAIEPNVAKEVGHPLNLWSGEDKPDWLDDRGVCKYQARALIGHNRAATVGDVTKENAHPFVFNDVYGVHNGSLWYYKDLEGDHDVDSKAIYDTIESKGIDHCWENLCGAAALVWWDQDKQLLNFVRNDKRPLYMYETNRRSLYWSSEVWMMNVAMARHKIPEKKTQVKNETTGAITTKTVLPRMLKPNTLYSYSLTQTDIKLEEERPLTEKKYGKTTTKVGFGTGSQKCVQDEVEKRGLKESLGNSWANGLPKADKEFRGMYAVADYVVKLGSGSTFVYYVVAKLFDKQGNAVNSRVEIYPRNIAEFNKLKILHDKSAFSSPLVFKIKCRPREFKGRQNDSLRLSAQYAGIVKKNTNIYKKICNSRIKNSNAVVGNGTPHNVVNMDKRKDDDLKSDADFLKGYGGIRVPRWELQDQLNHAGQCCAYCGYVVDPDDADDIFWVNKETILCYGCSNDQLVHDQLRGYK